MQVKLLRVLEDKTFHRIGSNDVIKFNARIIAATNKDLEQQVKNNKFREDLYYRLNVFPIHIPPLRERAEDIPLLIHELVNRMQADNRGNLRLLPDAIDALCKYNWPGNVRELANLIERLSILYAGVVVSINDLPEKFRQMSQQAPLKGSTKLNKKEDITNKVDIEENKRISFKIYMEEIEIELLREALEQNNWIVAKTANYLNLKRTTLIEKMRKYGLSASRK
jgi:sigma-54 specific flagellar transcriptional regulator A